MKVIHIGKRVPKALKELGYRETANSMHLGHGVWVFSLEKISVRKLKEQNQIAKSSLGKSEKGKAR